MGTDSSGSLEATISDGDNRQIKGIVTLRLMNKRHGVGKNARLKTGLGNREKLFPAAKTILFSGYCKSVANLAFCGVGFALSRYRRPRVGPSKVEKEFECGGRKNGIRKRESLPRRTQRPRA